MKLLRTVMILALSLGATSALAQDYARPGLYAQLNGVASFDSFDGVPSSVLDTAIGASGRVGYRLMPMLAIEGQVEYSGDFVDCCDTDITTTLLTANAKFYVLQDQVQPYLLAGMGGAFANVNTSGFGSADENAFAVKVGGGVDFYVNERFGLMLEAVYNIGTGDLDDFNYTGLGWGAFYRF
jgi:opacity protein-like surface antigen